MCFNEHEFKKRNVLQYAPAYGFHKCTFYPGSWTVIHSNATHVTFSSCTFENGAVIVAPGFEGILTIKHCTISPKTRFSVGKCKIDVKNKNQNQGTKWLPSRCASIRIKNEGYNMPIPDYIPYGTLVYFDDEKSLKDDELTDLVYRYPRFNVCLSRWETRGHFYALSTYKNRFNDKIIITLLYIANIKKSPLNQLPTDLIRICYDFIRV